jgi:hypothetical protein
MLTNSLNLERRLKHIALSVGNKCYTMFIWFDTKLIFKSVCLLKEKQTLRRGYRNSKTVVIHDHSGLIRCTQAQVGIIVAPIRNRGGPPDLGNLTIATLSPSLHYIPQQKRNIRKESLQSTSQCSNGLEPLFTCIDRMAFQLIWLKKCCKKKKHMQGSSLITSGDNQVNIFKLQI